MRIDPHVHLRDEEQNYKETIVHGLDTAKKMGVDIVFDMPNTQKPILTEEDVVRRLKLVPDAEKGRYFLYIGATADAEQLKNAAKLVEEVKEVIGIKMFAGKSTGTLEIIDEDEQKGVYSVLAKCGYTGVLAVHCEKEAHITDTFDPKNPITHATSRPNSAEHESIKDQIRFAQESGFQGTLHICHTSTKESVELVNEARKEMKITCGVTPHHLLFDDSKMNESHGLLYKMNPPLRSKKDVEALRNYLKEGKIDWIETDHAPHTVGEKLYDGYPSGFPSLYLYKELVEELLPSLGLSEGEIENLTYNNIIKAFKLKTGE
ncbi:MAG: amidohydrolase family protein [Patescibacteria group bacterium]